MAFNTYQYEFASGDRTEQVKSILFQNPIALENVYRIKFFKEEDISGNFQTKEFQYSFDSVIWSNWNTLTQQNLSKIQTRDNPNFYLKIKYTRTGIGAANILRFYLFYESDTLAPTPQPDDASCSCTYFGGELPEYYLNRENHFGSFKDLIVENIDGTGIPVYNDRSDSSIGTTLRFNKIEGRGGIIVSKEPGAVVITGSTIDASGIPTFYNPNPVVETVGGISAGETFFDASTSTSKGKTFGETMQAMFYPTLTPALSNPFNGFGDNVSNLQEIGTNLNITFTATFNRGSINPAYGTSGFRSGLPNTYNYSGSGLPVAVPSTSLSDSQNLPSYIVLQGNQSWTSVVSYDAGEQPLDSIGDPFNSPLPAGNTSSKSTTFEGVYPLFGTTANILTFTKQSLVSMISGNNIEFNMVPESGGNKQVFEIPDTWIGSRALIGIETFNTVSSSWAYEGGSASASLTKWDITSSSETIQGNVIGYKQYTYNGTDRSAIKIRLKF